MIVVEHGPVKLLPGYAKILHLGGMGTEELFLDDVIIQEKVDGSQFGWGLTFEGNFEMRSHHAYVHPEIPGGMFSAGVSHLNNVVNQRVRDNFEPGSQFFAEILRQPKHNVLKYGRVPLNHFVLFDALIGGKWATYEELKQYAELFEVDVVPELYRGPANLEIVQKLLETPSFLGDTLVEGVVIKNYNRFIDLHGKVFPVFAKYVRPEFKEKLASKIGKERNSLDDFLTSFGAEPRWQKALIHLQEQGEIVGEKQDIGKLVGEVIRDIREEEEENIKEFLYKHFLKKIVQNCTRGLPEWYKEKLTENLEVA
jgi:hypothetical protein